MNKQTIMITMGMMMLMMITFVNAVDVIAGNSYTFQVDTTLELNWNVIGNSSNMEGFNVSQEIYSNYSDITLSFHPLYKSDNFTLILFDREGEIIIEHNHDHDSGSSGGGSCSYDKNFDWECSTWGPCEDEEQVRICKKYNNCHNTYGRPDVIKSCEEVIDIDDGDNDYEDDGDNDPDPDDPDRIYWSDIFYWILIFLVAFIGLLWFIYYLINKDKGKNKNENE